MYTIISRRCQVGLQALLLMLGALGSPAHAATWTVDSTSADPALSACTSAPADCSFPGAVSRLAQTGDTIVFAVASTQADLVFLFRSVVIEAAGARLPRLHIASSERLLVEIRNAVFENLVASGEGGAIFIAERHSVRILDSRFRFNRAGTVGGAIFTRGHDVIVSRSLFEGNYAPGGAGGIHMEVGTPQLPSALRVIDSVFRGNGILNPTGPGRTLGQFGALKADGELRVSGSLFEGNESRYASAIQSGSSLWIDNSTFVGNRTFWPTESGALLLGGPVRIVNSTIVGNGGTTGGGLHIYSSSDTQVVNTIIANNTGASPDINGRIFSHGHNLIRSRVGATVVGNVNGTDIYNADPRLLPLADNGGATRTLALGPDSPARDAGSACALSSFGCGALPEVGLDTDQRGTGFARRLGNQVDIGAVEMGSVLVTNTQDSGAGSLRQAIADAMPWDVIGFARPFFDQPRTIALANPLVINKPLTVFGPGVDLLTLDAGNQRRHLNLDAPAILNLSGMRFIRGNPGVNGDGGAILVSAGSLNASDIRIEDSTANGGGCLYNNGTLDLLRVRLSGCQANYSAGLFNETGRTAVIRDSRIDNNIASGPGGGIGNQPGAILILERVSLNGNQGTIGGGLSSYGTATLTNTTFSGNTADNGGGMYLGGTGTTTLTHATVTLNTAQFNGGIAAESESTVNLRGTLVAGNTRTVDQAPDAGGSFVSLGHNLIGDPLGTVFRPTSPSLVGNLLGVQARLAALADNGGHSLTHAPQHNSPIIDAGGPGSTVDGRGLLRPVDFTSVANAASGNGSDIGAFELQVATPRNVVATPVSGGLSISFEGGADGGPAISGYRAVCGGLSAIGTASPILVTGLPLGVPVSCTVTASSGALTGIPSAPSNSAAAARVPSAPIIGTPIPGDRQVSVVFSPPASNGGSPITGYRARCGTQVQAGASSPIVVGGLANAVPVTCTVVATNVIGDSPESANSILVIPLPPLIFESGAPEDGQVRVMYFHQFFVAGALWFELDSGNLPPGLTLDVASGSLSGTPTAAGVYTARIRASDQLLRTVTQDVTITIAPNVPVAPTIGTAIAGDAQVTVSFTPPADDGGSPVQFYNVICTSIVGVGASSPIVVAPVPNGVPQTCSATAINAVGVSAVSAPANTVVPQAPTTMTVTSSAAEAIAGAPVTFTATLTPASAGGTVDFDLGPSAAGCAAAPLANGSASCTTQFTATGTFPISASYGGDAAHIGSTGQLAGGQLVLAPTITIDPALPGAVVGATYGPAQLTATGGLGPYTYAITQGALPPGLSLTTAGSLSGTPGTRGSYAFTVSATDQNQFTGTRAFELSVLAVPGAPTGVVATRGNAQVSVAFVPPTDNGGSAITGYTATCGSQSQSGSASPIVVTGLTNGTPVTCTVIATNAIGSSAPSAPSASVTPATVPGAPTGVAATRGNAQVSVAFVPPTNNGGSAITGYTATCGSQSQSGTASPIVVTGLVNGTPVTCTVIATNAIGNSAPSAPSASVTPATVPGAPTGVVATRGNAQVSVAFVPPTNNGGSAITGYTATCGSQSQSGSGSPLVVTGLTNGTPVTCTVIATNAIGNSAASAPSASVTPATVPGAPTGVVATRGNAQVSVAFVAPTDDGGSAITGYTATCGSQSQSGTASPIVVTGLVNGTPVTCTVIATNAIGNSAPSAPSASVTPATVPGAPTGVIATRGNAQVSVAFVPPTDNGGSAITGYTATCGSQSQSGSGSPLVVTGLTNGTPVTCTVIATNAIGNSAPSAPSASVTPATVPGAPTGVVATRGNAQVSVAFVPPTDNGGSAITGYTATCGSQSQSGSASPLVVTGLSNGTPVTCTVIATNAIGNSAASAPSASVTPATVPGAPTGVIATRGNAQVSVAFVPPTDNGGSAITGYTATCGSQSQSGSGSPLVVTGLTNGTPVTCTVIATNAIGNSAASAPSASVTPATVPGAPTGVIATRGNAQVSVAFVAPTDDGGSAITGYTATCGSQSQSGSASPIVVTNLTNGTPVTCTVIATNAIGNSAPSAPSASVTPATLPGAPGLLGATAGNGSASVRFAPPTDTGGAAILDYTVECMPGSVTAIGAGSPVNVTGLNNGTRYTCRVTARNAVGSGPPSQAASVIPTSQPVADVIVSVSNGTRYVTGGLPTTYTIVVRNAGPSGVADVRVESALGPEFTAASWTCSGQNGGVCAASGNGLTMDERVDLPAGASVTFLLAATVDALPETPVSHLVSATLPAPFSDPDLQSNVATDGPDVRGLFRDGLE